MAVTILREVSAGDTRSVSLIGKKELTLVTINGGVDNGEMFMGPSDRLCEGGKGG